LAAGILDMGANIAFLMASRMGLLMLASAITSLYPAPTVLLARMFMGQKLGPGRLAGLALAVAGTALIAMG
jgi:drug/metabolite transporter (DMT)-like permease